MPLLLLLLPALVVATQAATAGSIVSGYEDSVTELRKTIKGLVDLAEDGVNVARRKVGTEYVPWMENEWRLPVRQAAAEAGAAGAEKLARCSAADTIPAILEEVREEASQCVAERVPPGVPAVRQEAERLQRLCDQFLADAQAVAQQCDALPFFQGSMCMATQLAPMGGRIGGLGGLTGGLGGSVAALIDGSARNCTTKASGWRGGPGTRDAKAREVAGNIAACIRGHTTAATASSAMSSTSSMTTS